MPIYDYQCRKCGHRFEQLVKPNETPDCPACGAANPERFFPFSANVSTARTRERAIAPERRKARAAKAEKEHSHREYLAKEAKEHGE